MSMKKKTNLATNERIHPKKRKWHELVKIQNFNTEWRDSQSGRKWKSVLEKKLQQPFQE